MVPGERPRTRRALVFAVVPVLLATAVGAVLALTLGASEIESPPALRFSVISASGESLAANTPLALSRDGRRLAYAVGLNNLIAEADLYLHSFDGFTSRLLEGTHNATMPVFSPDEESIGFFGLSGGLRQVELSGGAATGLVDIAGGEPAGASWGADGTLVFAENWAQALKVKRPGQDTEAAWLSTLNRDAGEGGHMWPQILSNGRDVLFTIWSGSQSWDVARLAVADLETGRHRVIYDGGATGWDLWVASPGQGSDPRPLLDTEAAEKWARFSPDGRFIDFESVPLETDPGIVIRPFPEVDTGQWRVASGRRPVWSQDGREILYVTDDGIARVTVETDANSVAVSLGRPSPFLDMPGISSFDLSPDGQRLVIHRLLAETATREIRIIQNWFTELERLVPTQ
ncbi:MAG: hypothetical protein ABGY72_14640 [bacterium]